MNNMQVHEQKAPHAAAPAPQERSLVLVGLMGAGKSTVGRRLASALRLPFHDADQEIEAAAGCSISDFFERYGEKAFREGERKVIARLLAGPRHVLATGGGAALWARTTNPWGAIGAGAVLAHAAGASLADLEFCQFHPTALHLPGDARDGELLTEAIRGEGATLLDASGRRFTDELAPRDQVTAAILDRIKTDGTEHVRLDLRSISPQRFPNVFAACRAAGLDPAREPIPVAPAAHYLMGGVVCDLDAATTLPGLFAVGECACTGVHGANRLASNSLTECFVFGARAAAAAVGTADHGGALPLPEWRFEPPTAATREAVWKRAGPRRDASGLEALVDDPYPLARMIARVALERRESRGPHRRSDHRLPDPGLDGVHLVVGTDAEVRLEPWT